jgi:hypothetical protein
MSIVLQLKREILSFPGWQTKRKFIVIESDDWGSIRMPSRSAFNRLTENGIDLTTGDSKRYNLFDTLASAEDLEALFSVLKHFKDRQGNHPVFTSLCLTGNPDFEKIRQANFEHYYYESFIDTLKRYYPNQDVFMCWKHGMKERIFIPQFHGREHLNVNAWMKALQQGDQEAQLAFNEGVWGFNNRHMHDVSFQAAFDLDSITDLEDHRGIIIDGLLMFEKIFGYKARFFVPPNGILHESLYEITKSAGIGFIYSSKLHPVPIKPGKFTKRLNYLGRRNKAGQCFITRNAFFEPSQQPNDCVGNCLQEIETAFRWKKPAIISSHRVNYIGTLDVKNREQGLDKLRELLSAILKRWPDVEFVSTDQLGDLIIESTDGH